MELPLKWEVTRCMCVRYATIFAFVGIVFIVTSALIWLGTSATMMSRLLFDCGLFLCMTGVVQFITNIIITDVWKIYRSVEHQRANRRPKE